MERAPMQPQSNEQVNARNTAQLSAASPAQDHATSLIDTSPYVTGQSKSLQAMFGEAVAQRVEDDEEPVQGRFETVQRVEDEEKEEPVQGKFAAVQRIEDEEEMPLQGRFEPVQRVGHEAREEPNNTGLPDNLKAGVESLSGISLNNVRVHYNSSQPAQLSALAYAQGNDIHVAPGQEQHLPHEAWHVVQQAQGRVQPTMQAKGMPINDDRSLENEADEMGRMAASSQRPTPLTQQTLQRLQSRKFSGGIKITVSQRKVPANGTAKTRKNTANVGDYRPRGKRERFTKDKYGARGYFKFGKNTRDDVFKHCGCIFVGKRIVSVFVDGKLQNVEGVQLDHTISWSCIVDRMDQYNTTFNYTKDPYTLWDARMYYNDQDNLKPALAGINASAGEHGVSDNFISHPNLNDYLARLQLEYMNLQQGISAMKIAEDEELIAIKLSAASRALRDATDCLFRSKKRDQPDEDENITTTDKRGRFDTG